MKPVGKPDAGNPHVRFDERGWETERHAATALVLDSTTGSTLMPPRPCSIAFSGDRNYLPFPRKRGEGS